MLTTVRIDVEVTLLIDWIIGLKRSEAWETCFLPGTAMRGTWQWAHKGVTQALLGAAFLSSMRSFCPLLWWTRSSTLTRCLVSIIDTWCTEVTPGSNWGVLWELWGQQGSAQQDPKEHQRFVSSLFLLLMPSLGDNRSRCKKISGGRKEEERDKRMVYVLLPRWETQQVENDSGEGGVW